MASNSKIVLIQDNLKSLKNFEVVHKDLILNGERE